MVNSRAACSTVRHSARAQRSTVLEAVLHPVQSELRHLVVRSNHVCLNDSARDRNQSRAGTR
jgi:hypothetical protein